MFLEDGVGDFHRGIVFVGGETGFFGRQQTPKEIRWGSFYNNLGPSFEDIPLKEKDIYFLNQSLDDVLKVLNPIAGYARRKMKREEAELVVIQSGDELSISPNR